ncbi:MAG TPA: Gfo/Idh/MocA family oxidoreductase [Thermomicrobiales bacterium]|jgi:predicted dehydrogenase|nr:Gfo/Idh/MocA family oxidoreductase [Thermomicrobiales bacterium]
MTVRVGVLGAGFMGGTHARAYHGLPEVEVAAIYARSGDRAPALAADLGTSWTDDLQRVLADPTIDAIDICLPTPEHRAATEAALAAGKHVLLEKPIAMTLADADALVDLAAATDKVVMIAHVLRFWPEYVELQRQVAGGDLGRPISGFASRRQPFPAWSALFSRADLTGGAVVDMMIHDYDALNWIFGRPVAVTARGDRNPRSGGFDQVQVAIDYRNGASALVDGGMMMPESYPFSSRLEVLCERGAVEYAFRAGGRSVEMGAGQNELTRFGNDGQPERLTPPQADPYAAECAYFLDCVRAGKPATRATPDDARAALAVALAARDSVEQGGARIVIPE